MRTFYLDLPIFIIKSKYLATLGYHLTKAGELAIWGMFEKFMHLFSFLFGI